MAKKRAKRKKVKKSAKSSRKKATRKKAPRKKGKKAAKSSKKKSKGVSTPSNRSSLHLLRILLYAIIFLAFIVLFAFFGNVEVAGQEYFAPQNQVFLVTTTFILFLSVIIVALIIWGFYKQSQRVGHIGAPKGPKVKPGKVVKTPEDAPMESIDDELKRLAKELKALEK